MSPDVSDKLQTEVTVKVTYTGTDIKLTIPDIKVTSIQIPVENIASRKRLPLPNAAISPVDKVKKLKAEDLPPVDLAKNVLSFLAVKLAPNPQVAKPTVWLGAEAFTPNDRATKAVKLDGDATVVFWDTQKFGTLLGTRLPADGQLWFFHEHNEPVFIDIIAGYRKKPDSAVDAVATGAGEGVDKTVNKAGK